MTGRKGGILTDMRNADEVAAELARCNRRLKETRAELKKAKRQFGTALIKLVKMDPDFAAALLSMLKAREYRYADSGAEKVEN